MWTGIRGLWLAVTIIMAGVLTLAVSTDRKTQPAIYDLRVAGADSNDIADAPSVDMMTPVSRNALGAQRSARWIRARFDLEPEQINLIGPALHFAGPFSADVYLNGTLVGRKGRAALSAEDEEAGLIDSRLLLSSARPGENRLLVLVSSHHLPVETQNLFQDFTIAPVASGERRRASFYWIAISQIGFLAALAAAFAYGRRVTVSRQDRSVLDWSLVAALALSAALFAEISRAWINYPYPYHLARMSVLSLATVTFGVTYVFALAARFERFTHAWLIGAVLLVFLGSRTLLTTIDAGTLAMLAVCLLTATWVVAKGARRGDMAALPTGFALLAATVFAFIDPWAVLNNGIFAVGALLLAPGLARVLPPSTQAEALEAEASFSIETDNGLISLAIDDVIAIHAAGNYAEIVARDGGRQLARGAVSRIAAQLPPPFLQVHRSHIVNMACAKRLRVQTGSRYSLDMGDGEDIPVSRAQAGAVREALADYAG